MADNNFLDAWSMHVTPSSTPPGVGAIPPSQVADTMYQLGGHGIRGGLDQANGIWGTTLNGELRYYTRDDLKTWLAVDNLDDLEISFVGKTTDDLIEGVTNLYFTDQRAVNALRDENVSILTNDAGYQTEANVNALIQAALNGQTGYTDEQAQTAARSAISVTRNLDYDPATGVITGPDLSGYMTVLPDDVVRDADIGSLIESHLTAGDNVTFDTSGATLRINAAGGGTGEAKTDESIQDLIATTLVAGTNVTTAYDDVANTLTINSAIPDDVVRDADLHLVATSGLHRDLSSIPETATRWPTWAEVTAKPTEFDPAAHNHDWSDLTTGVPVTATRWPSYAEVTDKPATFPPSAHEHDWADITTGVPDFLTEVTTVDVVGNLTGGTNIEILADGTIRWTGTIPTSWAATDVTFDNAASGLTAENVQVAIDELTGIATATTTADDVPYTNTASTLAATDVRAAIDELDGKVEDQPEHFFGASTPTGATAGDYWFIP